MLGAISGVCEIAGNQVRDFRSFLPDQYKIEDNWHVAGLKGTGSKDIVVEETFVPEYRTQSHLDYAMNFDDVLLSPADRRALRSNTDGAAG